MNEAWIIDVARSPRGIGRAGKGALAHIHPQDLLTQILVALESRSRISSNEIDQLIVGCNAQVGSQRGDIGRMAALNAGWLNVSGTTVDHFCGSSLVAVAMAASGVISGMQDLVVAGGVEMMSIPFPPSFVMDQGNLALRAKHPMSSVGISADVIATEGGFSRETLDRYAVESQSRAANAINKEFFLKSIIPIKNVDGSIALDKDEYPRKTTLEDLSKLEPVFAQWMDMKMDEHNTFGDLARMKWPDLNIDHVHHAGNSSGIVDAAAGVVIASPAYARSRGLTPRARISTATNAAGSPEYNLNEPVPATLKALKKLGMHQNDIDLFEVNEAFAVVPVKYMQDLDISHDIVNVNGGAIALGHPIGATGAILLGTLLDELERRDLTTGLVTMCAAGGMAPCMVIERF